MSKALSQDCFLLYCMQDAPFPVPEVCKQREKASLSSSSEARGSTKVCRGGSQNHPHTDIERARAVLAFVVLRAAAKELLRIPRFHDVPVPSLTGNLQNLPPVNGARQAVLFDEQPLRYGKIFRNSPKGLPLFNLIKFISFRFQHLYSICRPCKKICHISPRRLVR